MEINVQPVNLNDCVNIMDAHFYKRVRDSSFIITVANEAGHAGKIVDNSHS